LKGGETIDNMNNPIKLIKNLWRGGMISLVVMTMVFGGLFLNLQAASANEQPNLTIRHLAANNDSGSNWGENVTVNSGDKVYFYSEIHNTVVGSRASWVTLKDSVTGGDFTDGTSVATASADNASSASDTVNIHINNGGHLEFLPGTARVTWDVNGDGNYEYNNTYVAGNPMSSDGLAIGDQDGCNNFIIQVGWTAKVVEGPKPSPTPSPSPSPSPSPTPSPKPTPSPTPSVTPSPSPSPSPTPVVSPSPSPSPAIVINNNQEQHQEQNNNQTVNIATGQVAGAKVPAKTPDTGVSVLGMVSMLGAGPVGFALTRFGRGRGITAKREETLSETASRLFGERNDA